MYRDLSTDKKLINIISLFKRMILILLIDFLFSFSKLQTQIYILRIEVCELLIKLLYKLYSFNYKPKRELEHILYTNLYIINSSSESRPLKGFYLVFIFKSILDYLFIEISQLKFSLLSLEIRIYTSYHYITLFQEAIYYNSPLS